MTIKPIKPNRPPSPTDIADRDRWDALTDKSLERTQAVAEKWRTGLAGLVTLMTGSLLLKGATSAANIDRSWLTVLSVMSVASVGLAIVGLWWALRAAAGAPTEVAYDELHASFGGVRQFEIAAARRVAKLLEDAQAAVAMSLVLFGLNAIVWWWAPPVDSDDIQDVNVTTEDGPICGDLISGDNQRLRVQVDGESEVRSVPFSEITNIGVVDGC